MFLVPTVLGPSPIHGLGVFCNVALDAGQEIWRFDERVDWRLAEGDLLAMPPTFQAIMRVYCFHEPDGTFVFCGDNARFMNHSDAPNCDDDGVTIRANQAIAPGVELTCDYRSFDTDSAQGLESYVSIAPDDPSAPDTT